MMNTIVDRAGLHHAQSSSGHAIVRRQQGLSWFEFGMGMFALAVPVGVLLVVTAPIDVLQTLGTLIAGIGVIGMWVSGLGLRIEHPDRWHALVARWVRTRPTERQRAHAKPI